MAKTIGCRAFDHVEKLVQDFPLVGFRLAYGVRTRWSNEKCLRLSTRIERMLDKKYKLPQTAVVHNLLRDPTGQRRIVVEVDVPVNISGWEHAPK